MLFRAIGGYCVAVLLVVAQPALAAPLKICTFKVDATPPLDSPLCDGAVPPGQGDRRSAHDPRRRAARQRRADRLVRSTGSASATAATTRFARRWPPRPARRSIAWPSTRCISTMPRAAISRPTSCSPRRAWPRDVPRRVCSTTIDRPRGRSGEESLAKPSRNASGHRRGRVEKSPRIAACSAPMAKSNSCVTSLTIDKKPGPRPRA